MTSAHYGQVRKELRNSAQSTAGRLVGAPTCASFTTQCGIRGGLCSSKGRRITSQDPIGAMALPPDGHSDRLESATARGTNEERRVVPAAKRIDTSYYSRSCLHAHLRTTSMTRTSSPAVPMARPSHCSRLSSVG